MIVRKPDETTLSEYYRSYMKYVPGDDVLAALISQQTELKNFFGSIPKEKETFAYAPGKWTIRELLGHLCDTERILSYRALRISRNDTTPLPGFEENDYAREANYKSRNLDDILQELLAVRETTIQLYSHMDEAWFDRSAIVNNTKQTVRALLFFTVGHAAHHSAIVAERYL